MFSISNSANNCAKIQLGNFLFRSAEIISFQTCESKINPNYRRDEKTLNESNDNVIHLSHCLPELDAGFLKWYSKYFGTNVPKPIIPNRRKIVDRELNTKT